MDAKQEPSQSEFIKLAIPNILTNLSLPLAGLVDFALLGHLPDVAPLAGVALAIVLFDFAYWSFGFLRMGTVGLVAKAYGAKDHFATAGIFFRGFGLAMVLGVLLIILQIPCGELGFALLGGEPDVEASGKAYFYARIWAAPATLGGYVLIGWLLGRSRAKDAMLCAFALNFLNIAFDYIFINIMQWGAHGAGMATMLAEYIAFFFGLWLVKRAWTGLPGFDKAYFKDRAAFGSLMKLNGNIMVRSFTMVSTFALFTNFSAVFGEATLAANALLLRLLNTAAYFIDGFAYALESLSGRFAGAEKWAAVKRTLKLAMSWNMAAVVLFVFVFIVFGREILQLLNDHEEVVEVGMQFMPWVWGTLLVSGFAYVYDGFFIGLADGKSLRNSMLWASLVGFLPLGLLSQYVSNPRLLWWAMFTFLLIRAATLGLSSRKLLDRKMAA